MEGQPYNPNPREPQPVKPLGGTAQTIENWKKVLTNKSDEEIRALMSSHTSRDVEYIAADLVLAERKQERDPHTALLSELNKQIATMDGRLEKVADTATKPDWKKATFWVAMGSLFLAGIAAAISLCAWLFPRSPSDANRQSNSPLQSNAAPFAPSSSQSIAYTQSISSQETGSISTNKSLPMPKALTNAGSLKPYQP